MKTLALSILGILAFTGFSFADIEEDNFRKLDEYGKACRKIDEDYENRLSQENARYQQELAKYEAQLKLIHDGKASRLAPNPTRPERQPVFKGFYPLLPTLGKKKYDEPAKAPNVINLQPAVVLPKFFPNTNRQPAYIERSDSNYEAQIAAIDAKHDAMAAARNASRTAADQRQEMANARMSLQQAKFAQDAEIVRMRQEQEFEAQRIRVENQTQNDEIERLRFQQQTETMLLNSRR